MGLAGVEWVPPDRTIVGLTGSGWCEDLLERALWRCRGTEPRGGSRDAVRFSRIFYFLLHSFWCRHGRAVGRIGEPDADRASAAWRGAIVRGYVPLNW